MKKKNNIFKWILWGFLVLIVILLIIIMLIPFFLPLDKIKDIAVARMSESLKREVRIEGISFNIFKGLKLNQLYIGNRKGFTEEPFISADAIELRFNLLSLILQRKIEANKLVLVKPEILIERASSGELNVSDLLAKKKVKEAPKEKKAPISFLVSEFSVSNGNLIFLDRMPKEPVRSGLSDLNLDVSNISLKTIKPMVIKTVANGIYEDNPIKIGMYGKVDLDIDKENIKISDFTTKIGRDSLLTNAEIQNFKAPNINIKIFSTGFALDPLLTLISGGEKEEKKERIYGELTRSVNRTMSFIPPGLSLDGALNIKNLSYRKLNIDEIKTDIDISGGVASLDLQGIKAYEGTLTGKGSVNLRASGLSYSVSEIELKDFNAAPFSNALMKSFFPEHEGLTDKIEGKLEFSGSLSGAGVEQPDILTNLKGSGFIEITNGKLSRTESLTSVGKKIGLTIFEKDITISSLSAKLNAKNKILNIFPLKLRDTDANVDFNGSLNLGEMRYVPGNKLKVVLSPEAAKSLPKEYDTLKDKDGGASLEFELIGSLTKPIPIPKFEHLLRKAIEKEKEKATEQLKEEVKKEGEKLLKDILKIQ